MGRPLGSKNEKPFKDALRMEIAAAGTSFDLRQVAKALIAQAVSGDVRAIREIADRLDGKPATVIEGGERPIDVHTRIERVIIDPKAAAKD